MLQCTGVTFIFICSGFLTIYFLLSIFCSPSPCLCLFWMKWIVGSFFLKSFWSNYLWIDLIWFFRFWQAVHGMEYGFGAHEYPTSGVFEVEPRSCPGFNFRRSVLLGSTDMSRAEFRSFMEHLSGKYHGDTYHLIAKNCNHFTDEVCMQLTGKPIPGWVNRLARVGKRRFSSCHVTWEISLKLTRSLLTLVIIIGIALVF